MHYATCAKHETEVGEADCASCIIEDLEARISTLEDHIIFKRTEVLEAEGWILKVGAEQERIREALNALLDAVAPNVGRFADGEPINPMGHAYDDACKAVGRDPEPTGDEE